MFINFIDPECYCHKNVSQQFIEVHHSLTLEDIQRRVTQ